MRSTGLAVVLSAVLIGTALADDVSAADGELFPTGKNDQITHRASLCGSPLGVTQTLISFHPPSFVFTADTPAANKAVPKTDTSGIAPPSLFKQLSLRSLRTAAPIVPLGNSLGNKCGIPALCWYFVQGLRH